MEIDINNACNCNKQAARQSEISYNVITNIVWQILSPDKWGKMMLQEENRRPIMEFYTNSESGLLFILTHSQGHLYPTTEWPQVP